MKALLLSALFPALVACAAEPQSNPEPGEIDTDEDVGTIAQASTILTTQVAGQKLVITDVANVAATTTRIAACGNGAIYATRTDGSLWFNRTGGTNNTGDWVQVTNTPPGTKIACDRQHLFSYDGTHLWHATTAMDGQIWTDGWKRTNDGRTLTMPAGATEISSGAGAIYALKPATSSTPATLWDSELRQPKETYGTRAEGADWVQLANNLGSSRATGAGSKGWFTSYTNSLPYVHRNRAFGANIDDTLYFNNDMVYGSNGWTVFPNGGVDIQQISAEDSNTLYALAADGLFGKRIVRYSFTEGNCTNNLDDDANGLTDAEDSSCRGVLATSFCQGKSSGSYCIDRIENTDGYDHALVSCRAGGQQPLIQAGLCSHGTGTGNDFLTTLPTNNEPVHAGHYCSVIHSDGTWNVSWSGTDPCAGILRTGSVIARAGIYSTTEQNSVHVHCNNGYYTTQGDGSAPISTANNAVGHTANRCYFTVSPQYMGSFNAPFPTLTWDSFYGHGYGVGHIFDHIPKCEAGDPGCTAICPNGGDCSINAGQFGNGDTNTRTTIDSDGLASTHDGQNGYDFGVGEGTPLRSLAYGRVVDSRDRDVNGYSFGTPKQGELYIEYDVGSNTRYQERFIAYYAHLGQRTVVTGQTVEPGQLLGYSGVIGSSSGPHLHFGMIRLTNTNARRAGTNGETFGYQMPFSTTLDNYGFEPETWGSSVDPFGFRAPTGIDPVGYLYTNLQSSKSDNVLGFGAWSPIMFYGGETPPCCQ